MASINLTDILLILGSRIHDRKTLFNLCLVNKTFNQIFSEYYYRELFFCERNSYWLIDLSKLNLIRSNTRCLSHVKHFTFCVYADRDMSIVAPFYDTIYPSEICQRASWWASACSSVDSLLEHMPRLESFTWVGYPLQHRVVERLQSHCPYLKSFTVVVPQNLNLRLGQKVNFFHEPIRAPDERKWTTVLGSEGRIPLLPPFENLERLHLHHLWGSDLGLWRKMIVKVLLKSPGLRDLGLSMSGSTRWRLSHLNMHQNNPALHPAHFLRELCKLYRELGGKPLSLISLHLGHYMFVLRAGSNPRRLRPEFADESENGRYLDALVNMSGVQELTMDLINDGGFGGDIPDEFQGYNDVSWWPTAPGPTPRLEKLSIRMPTSWFMRWARRMVETGAPLRQIKVNEAAFPGTPPYPLDNAEPSNIAVNWTQLLICRPQELMFFRASRAAISFDETTACKSIQYLATDCHTFCENVNMLASRMPQLKGLYIMNKSSSKGRVHFYDDYGGGIANIQEEKAEWEAIVLGAAVIIDGLKYMRINSITWRIDRTSGLVLHELDRMENDHEIPDLFRIGIPYEFDVAHAAKFWVGNRVRDRDELM
ncbi:hypothetical protein F4805DRAFT_479042 [Annulohypoxylon moriforme]|nr:hypothetical protein F4805DRAFT_479042 [Annulohypoxylon moriforme]